MKRGSKNKKDNNIKILKVNEKYDGIEIQENREIQVYF